MEYVDVQGELDRLTAAGLERRAAEIAEVFSAFPDLRLVRDCYGQLRFCSESVNDQVDSIAMDSCHDCDGKPIKLWTFVTVDEKGSRIYSDPPAFVIADQNPKGFGEIPRAGWEEALQSYGVPRSVIVKVRLHLSGHPPINYSDED